MTGRSRFFMSCIVPPEASTDFRDACRDQLMGIGVLVDHWIRRIDDTESTRRGEREEIPIE